MSEEIEFGTLLKSLRIRYGVDTQGELAQLVGVSRQAVVYWETGRHLPERSRVLSIADVLGVTDEEREQLFRASSSAGVEKDSDGPASTEVDLISVLRSRLLAACQKMPTSSGLVLSWEAWMPRKLTLPGTAALTPQAAIKKYPRFVLSGEAGSGKSVLEDWYVWALLTEKIPLDLLPLKIGLADFAKHKTDHKGSLTAYITHTLYHHLFTNEEQVLLKAELDRLNAQRGLIYLCDEWDQLSEGEWVELRRILKQAACYVIATRLADIGIEQDAPNALTLELLTLRQVKKLVSTWAQVSTPKFGIDKVLEFLESEAGLGTVAFQPLYIEGACRAAASGKLDFSTVVEQTLAWSMAKVAPPANIPHSQIQCALRRMAHQQMLGAMPGSLLPSLVMRRSAVEMVLQEDEIEQADALLDYAQRVGILKPVGTGQIAWSNAACEVKFTVEQIVDECLASRSPAISILGPAWRLALLTAARSLRGSSLAARGLIEAILNQTEMLSLHHLLAAECLAQMGPPWADELTEERLIVEHRVVEFCAADSGPVVRKTCARLLEQLDSTAELPIAPDTWGADNPPPPNPLSVAQFIQMARWLQESILPKETRLSLARQLSLSRLPAANDPEWQNAHWITPTLDRMIFAEWSRSRVSYGVGGLLWLWERERDPLVRSFLTLALARPEFLPELLAFEPLPLPPLRELALRYGFLILAKRSEWPRYVFKLCLRDGATADVQSGENQGLVERLALGVVSGS